MKSRSTARRAACPRCGCRLSRTHGSYLRFPRDLPTSGKLVVMSLRVRRSVCAEGSCPRQTFAEQVSGSPVDSLAGQNSGDRRSSR
ncbi:transposase family protein [Streptomyces sp. NPDC058861]|uniref:transposase family protein n=1 Tax=Streptomyces sp. NPDC058861 TaxID=3346653 RepID=UPI003688DDA0